MLLFFSSFAGMYSWLQLQKYRARKEVKANVITRLAPEHMQRLSFPKNSEPPGMRWLHEDEFELNGTLYDVLKVEERNDSVFLRIWEDSNETALNRQIKSLTNRLVQASPETPEEEARWVQFMKQLMPALEIWRFSSTPELPVRVGNTSRELIAAVHTAPPSPPPERTGFKD